MSDVTESCWSPTDSDCNTVTVTVNYLTSIHFDQLKQTSSAIYSLFQKCFSFM